MVNFIPGPNYFPRFKPSYSSHSQTETSYLKVSVFPIFYKQTVVEWDIPSEWGACKFDVLRSETEVGPWNKVTEEPTAQYYFKDRSNPEVSKFNTYFYIVECILPSGQRIISPVTTWEAKRHSFVEIRAREITRRETLLLTKFVGVKTIFFRRKRFGQRCSTCWDPTSESVTLDHCPDCLGTSFEGGYFGGYETLLQYDPTPSAVEFSYQGKVERNAITAWTTSRPTIESLDLVLRVPDLRLYRVGEKQTTELQTVQVRQILQLVELAKDRVEYQVIKKLLPPEYL